MKKLLTSIFTVLFVVLSVNVIAQHKFVIGDVTFKEKKDAIEYLDKQIEKFEEKLEKEEKKHRKALKKDSTAMLSIDHSFYSSQIKVLQQYKMKALEKMVNDSTNVRIESKSYSAYGSAHLYKEVKRANGNDSNQTVTTTAFTGGTMKVLLMNQNKYRQHSVKVFEVRGNPELERGRYDVVEYKKIRQVAAVLLPKEGKEVIELHPGFYVVEFYYKSSRPDFAHVLVLDPDKQVIVPDEYLQGLTGITADQIGGFVFKE